MFLRFLGLLLLIASSFAQVIKHIPPSQPKLPIKFVYVSKVKSWRSAHAIAESLGVPGFSQHNFNHIALTFWLCAHGPVDTALLWDNPIHFMGPTSTFGYTNEQIRANLKQRYNKNGVKLLVSAFGATQIPTRQGFNPLKCADKLADFVIKTGLDGVDIDWEDSGALQIKKYRGEEWLIKLTNRLRDRLPHHIITHAPQAPYFMGTSKYPNNGYLKVHQEVGSKIDFYNVQFYNQGTTSYLHFQGLFKKSGGWAHGTSVNEIASKGIPLEKIVVGKPASSSDAYESSSLMNPQDLNKIFVKAHQFNGWKTGMMEWQFISDSDSAKMDMAMSGLMNLLDQSQTESNRNGKPTFFSTFSEQSGLANWGGKGPKEVFPFQKEGVQQWGESTQFTSFQGSFSSSFTHQWSELP